MRALLRFTVIKAVLGVFRENSNGVCATFPPARLFFAVLSTVNGVFFTRYINGVRAFWNPARLIQNVFFTVLVAVIVPIMLLINLKPIAATIEPARMARHRLALGTALVLFFFAPGALY